MRPSGWYVPNWLLSMAAYYAQEAYNTPRQNGFSSAITGALGFVCHEGDYQIISFRGSANVRNWFLNATAVPVPFCGGFAHAGFRAYHASIWRAIERELSPDKKTLITGHSLGGAAAEQTRAVLAKAGWDVDMVTFGKPNLWFKALSPPVENGGYLISVVHGSDVVARIPRYAYRPPYYQNMLYFGNDGNDVWDPDIAHRRADWSPFDLASDHSMLAYKARMENFIKTNPRGASSDS